MDGGARFVYNVIYHLLRSISLTCMASMKQVSLSLFLILTQTPGWLSRRLTTSVWPEPAAYIRGTQPRQFRVLTSSPWSRSLRTVARSPLSEAPQIPRPAPSSAGGPSRKSMFVGVVTDSVRDRAEDIVTSILRY